jgi:hypothetical protein
MIANASFYFCQNQILTLMKRKIFTNVKLILGLLIPLAFIRPVYSQSGTDTLAPQVTNLKDKISGIEERITNMETDVAKLTKIHLSGYIQAQWLQFEASNVYPNNTFMIRRARVKVSYEPANGLIFALEPDFTPGNITIKNAYVQVNDPWLKTFALWAGKFDRPNYEVETSSSALDFPERSRVITTLYPDEKDIGIKLEVLPHKTHLKVQLALLNGNQGYTYSDAAGNVINAPQTNTDFDNHKDFVARATYAFKLGHWGGLTVGGTGYFGGIKANSNDLLNSDYTYNKAESNAGSVIKRTWYGAELQFYADVLGGLTLKGEYIMGINGAPGYYSPSSTVYGGTTATTKNDTLTLTSLTTVTKSLRPAIERNFSGYYISLVKNIGKRNQIGIRYDFYDPNTKITTDSIGAVTAKYSKSTTVVTDKYTYSGSGPVVRNDAQTKTITNNSLASGTGDIAYGTWTFCWTYYFDDNIKFQVGYAIPMNQTVAKANQLTQNYSVNNSTGAYYDYSNQLKQNLLTVRLQVKF